MKTIKILFLCGTIALSFFACKKKEDQPTAAPQLIFKFKFDSTQVRLNNLGQPSEMPADHAGQCPKFNKMSTHYVELAQTATTQLGKGAVLYKNEETTLGGATAIRF